MEIFLSNIQPYLTTYRSFSPHFRECLEQADIINIASGYISTEAITELKKIVELNRKPYINLLIGMHHFDGFTNVQFQSAKYLNDFLNANQLGKVSVSTAFKFHGKIYAFEKNGQTYSSVIGSSNLGSLLGNTKIYETDVLFTEPDFCNRTKSIIHGLIDKSGTPFEQYVSPNIIPEKNRLLEDHELVEDVGTISYQKLLNQSRNKRSFTLPIKADEAPRSNLNAYFGRGRENQKGFIQPRHWYEVELIVPTAITHDSEYPKNKEFTVTTDDGWRFNCKTSGENSKNFRSQGDLKILGKWLKGRLELSGFLKVGEPVTDAVLQSYGRNNIELIPTSNPNNWLLNFSRE